ncbi:hypothetical protein EIL50_00365 [bacterium NHP-B]|nr:hypothetical protein EIL50_00365 [bacterium NHP-B]
MGTTYFRALLAGRRQHVPLARQSLFFMTLERFVRMGQSPREALRLLSAEKDRLLARLSQRCLEAMEKGAHLSQALEASGYAVAPVVLPLLTAAEETGTMPVLLRRVVTYLDAAEKMKAGTWAMVRYPLFSLMAVLVSFYCLYSFLWPQLIIFVEDRPQDVGWATASLLFLSSCGREKTTFVVAFVGVVGLLCVVFLYATSTGRWLWHKMVLSIPLLSQMILSLRWAHFFSVLSLSVKSSLTLPQALAVAEKVLDYAPLKEALHHVRQRVDSGQPLSESMRGVPGLTPEALHFLALAEHTGEIQEIFAHISHGYHGQRERLAARWQSYMPLFILMITGMMFVWIICGIVLPFYDHMLNMASGVVQT